MEHDYESDRLPNSGCGRATRQWKVYFGPHDIEKHHQSYHCPPQDRPTFSAEKFAQGILDFLDVPPPETQINTALNRVEKSLAACKKDKRVPIIHVEVDVRCNSNQLQNLLILLKIWGEDMQLVRAVVTMSSSRAALGLFIDMPELRADIFEIEDYTDEEAYQYIYEIVCGMLRGKIQTLLFEFV